MSGGVGGAEQATLTFMVGGTENAYKMMLPLFEYNGEKIVIMEFLPVQDKQQKHVIICC